MSRPPVFNPFAAALLAACCAGACAATQADIDQANLETQYWQAKATTAQSQASVANARLGTLSTSGLTKPSGDASDLNVEANLLAYAAADKAAGAIATQVKAVVGAAPVVIYIETDMNALEQSKAFLASLTTLSTAIDKFKLAPLAADNASCSEPAEGGFGIGPLGALSVGLQIVQLFNVDKKMAGTAVTVDDFAFAALVARRLREDGVAGVVYPPLYISHAFGTAGADPYADSTIAKLLNALDDEEAKVDKVVAAIGSHRDDLLKREADKAHPLTDTCKAAFKAARAAYDINEAKAAALKARADKLLAAAATVDDKTGASLLQLLVRSERMSRALPAAFVLQVKPIAAGGTTLTRTSLFSTSFRFSGGAVVAYMLVDGSTGALVASGTVGEYGGAVEPEQLQSVLSPAPSRP